MRKLFIVIALFFASPVYAEVQESYLTKGIRYFQKEQYFKATLQFQKAIETGDHSAHVYYNLGASHFKLGRYTDARNAFLVSVKNPGLRQISEYNLGLIAYRQKNKTEALDWFYSASSSVGSKKITALANRMLDKIQPATRSLNMSGILVAGTGSDSNVTLASTNSPTQKSDTYNELFAYVDIPISSSLTLNTNFLSQKYNTVAISNYSHVSVGGKYSMKMAGWNLRPELHIKTSTLNGAAYQQDTDLLFTGNKKQNKSDAILFRYRYNQINSQNTTYDYLQGSRQQLRVQYYQGLHKGSLRYRYEFEANARQNTVTENYSPTRHTIRLRYKTYLRSWAMTYEAGMRLSTYGAVAGNVRQDTRTRLKVEGLKSLSESIKLGLRYVHLNNKSNRAVETYVKNDIQMFLTYKF